MRAIFLRASSTSLTLSHSLSLPLSLTLTRRLGMRGIHSLRSDRMIRQSCDQRRGKKGKEAREAAAVPVTRSLLLLLLLLRFTCCAHTTTQKQQLNPHRFSLPSPSSHSLHPLLSLLSLFHFSLPSLLSSQSIAAAHFDSLLPPASACLPASLPECNSPSSSS